MIQWLVVAILVLASALYALWSLMPPRARLRLLDAIAGQSPRVAWAARLRRTALAELAGGCGSCAANGDDGSAIVQTPRKSK